MSKIAQFTEEEREKKVRKKKKALLEESNSKVKTALVQLYFNNYLN